jgi:hypothetical protein
VQIVVFPTAPPHEYRSPITTQSPGLPPMAYTVLVCWLVDQSLNYIGEPPDVKTGLLAQLVLWIKPFRMPDIAH